MAPRKRLLIDDPPSATTTTSESSDDEKNDYIQLPSQPVVEGEEEIGDEDSSSEEDDDSSSEELQHSQPASQNPPPSTPISNPKPVASAESESGSDSDSEPKPTAPLASKPIKAQPQAQSPAQAQTTPKSGKKRAVDDNNANGNASKRSKGKETVSAAAGGSGEKNDDMEEDVRLTGDDSKKTFRRIFSEEDELVILKGLIDFISKTGKDPLKNIAVFHDFVKKSLHATASNQQIKRKIRGLKEKFESSHSFNKSHDKEAFELFKKISWGNNGGNVAGEENGKDVNVKSPKKDVNVKVKHIGSSSKNVESVVDNNVILNEICRFGVDMGLSALNKDAVKQGLEKIAESSRAEMERQWRRLHVTEWEVIVNRAQLVKEHSSSILEELKKLTH